jgi:hypothetical protein
MVTDPISLPFSIKKVHSGFARMDGIVKVSERGLTIEYEVKVLGLVRLQVRECHIPISEIESYQLKKSWFSTRLVVRTKSLRTLCTFPGSNQAEVVFKIRRSRRKTAEQLIALLGLHTSDYVLQCLLNRTEDFNRFSELNTSARMR